MWICANYLALQALKLKYATGSEQGAKLYNGLRYSIPLRATIVKMQSIMHRHWRFFLHLSIGFSLPLWILLTRPLMIMMMMSLSSLQGGDCGQYGRAVWSQGVHF